MSPKKLIASIFLLLTYTLGLAHEIIPHCHHNTVGQEIGGHHVVDHKHHHNHNTCEENKSTHFDHRDHCDSGLLGFVVCLMSETEHPTSCDERSLHLPSLAHDLNAGHSFKMLLPTAITPTVLDFAVVEKEHDCFLEAPTHYRSPHHACIGLRGPPLISC